MPSAPLAPVDLAADGARRTPTADAGGGARPARRAGVEPGLRVADRRRGRAASAVARGRTAAFRRRAPNRAEVEVVDHLDDQVVEVLDQRDAGVGVAGDAERAQHQLAELVGGRDGGGVEAGQGVARAGARRCRDLVVGAGEPGG